MQEVTSQNHFINYFEVKEIEPEKEPIILTDPTTNSKQYQCPYDSCQRIFKEKGNLKTHIRVHVSSFNHFILDRRKTLRLLLS